MKKLVTTDVHMLNIEQCNAEMVGRQSLHPSLNEEHDLS